MLWGCSSSTRWVSHHEGRSSRCPSPTFWWLQPWLMCCWQPHEKTQARTSLAELLLNSWSPETVGDNKCLSSSSLRLEVSCYTEIENWYNKPQLKRKGLPDHTREHTYPEYRKSFHNTVIKNKISKAKDLNWNFTKDLWVANKHTKRCLTPFIIREIQIKITLRHIYTPIRIESISKPESSRRWQGYRTTGTLTYCRRQCKMVWPLRKRAGQFLMKLNIYSSQDTAMPLILSREKGKLMFTRSLHMTGHW